MTIEETYAKIKSLEIQGAHNIAIAAVSAFDELLKTATEEKKNRAQLEKAVARLAHARATEPALRNALRYCLMNFDKDTNIAQAVLDHFKKSKEKIAEFGAKKIKDGMTIFTHCHSGTVTNILKMAWEEGRRFTVRNTETRPRFQGRITANELAEIGIPVVHSVDSAARLQIRGADLFLFGADAITTEGNVVNKIGTTLFAEFAEQFHVPIYACSDSWKFDPATVYGADVEIEERNCAEVWENPRKGVTVINPAFEITLADKISGIVTELGIFKPETLVLEIQKAYPWLIDDRSKIELRKLNNM